jgi:hypothetical protein
MKQDLYLKPTMPALSKKLWRPQIRYLPRFKACL